MAEQTGPLVVLTRAAEDNHRLAELLRERGVGVLEVPCLQTRYVGPGSPPEELDAVVFTSRRGVRGLLRDGSWRERLARRTAAAGEPSARPLVAAVGPATAADLEAYGIGADLIAVPPEGEILARMIARVVSPGGRIAVVRGNLRSGVLDEMLERNGYVLIPLVVYENVSPAIPSLEPVPVAAVFVASPSAGHRILQRNGWLRDCRFVCIGKTTQQALRTMGITSAVTAGPSMDDWVDALCEAHAQAIGSKE